MSVPRNFTVTPPPPPTPPPTPPPNADRENERLLQIPCHHCGQPQAKHWVVNYSDGQMVSGNVLICPTSVYKPNEKDARPYDLSRQPKVSKR